MALRKLSASETASIRKALDDARAGRSTLGQLGAAHDLAASAGLTGCVGELRQHIMSMAAVPNAPKPGRSRHLDLFGDVVAGVISGWLAHRLIS